MDDKSTTSIIADDIPVIIEVEVSAGEWERTLRHRTNTSQYERAASVGIRRGIYQAWEMDTTILPDKKLLTEIEWCRLMRWRAGMSQEDLAKKLGITRVWVNRMENGGVHPFKLLDYWEIDRHIREKTVAATKRPEVEVQDG